jgi:hypothetical protein
MKIKAIIKQCIFLIVPIVFMQGCLGKMFDKDEKKLMSYKKSNGKEISIVQIGLGATTEDVIQVRYEEKKEPIKIFTKYNYLEFSKLIDDTTLQMVLNDTGYFKNKADTFFIKIK